MCVCVWMFGSSEGVRGWETHVQQAMLYRSLSDGKMAMTTSAPAAVSQPAAQIICDSCTYSGTLARLHTTRGKKYKNLQPGRVKGGAC